MSDTISRGVINALIPDGAAWAPAEEEDLDLLYDGIAENHERVSDYVETLAYIRDPLNTPILTSLEKEYGFLLDSSLTETERRQRLAALVYAKRGTGTEDYLQDRLHEAGFTDLFVYPNDPAVNPNQFITSDYGTYFGGENSDFGNQDAFFSKYNGGEYLLNGDVYSQTVEYLLTFGNTANSFGNQDSIFGRFNTVKTRIIVDYVATLWNMVFFVGGAVTRGVSGEILTLEQVDIPENRRSDLFKIILRHKPLGTWAALNVSYVADDEVLKDTIGASDVYKDTIGAADVYKDTIL